MTTPWLTTMKPTFQTEWLALSAKESRQILEKINLLSQDPTPDAKVKKQLKYLGGKLHRLRSGNYRIFYTFDHPYVSLLALRRRDDDTYDEEIDAEFLGGLDPKFTDITKPNQLDWEKLFTVSDPPQTKLPEPITHELLENLRIPEPCHPRLIQVKTREELFDCPGIADDIILKLDDYLFERPLVDILQQPDFLTGDVDNLLRFKQGDIFGFLLKLNPEQEKYVTWAINASGPTLLKGGPGTGKSTVALYRVRAILETLKASPQPALSREESSSTPKLLFTTYTNALVAFSKALLANLLGDDIQYVEVKTADAIAYSIICQATGKPNLAQAKDLRRLIKQALPKAIDSLPGNLLQRQAQAQILERLNIDYLIAEINTVIEAREITALEDYLTTPRTGREIALNKTQRQAIWHLRHHLYQLLCEQGLETWQQLRSRALKILREMDNPPLYDAVIIDEAQDLEPNALRLLWQLCRHPNRLFVTADANQSIYGSSFRWRDIHQDLKFKGRTGILYVNHRTTKEINEAAHSYLVGGSLDDIVQRDYIHTGPPPAVRSVTTSADEAALLTRFCKSAAREFRLGIGACAILTPTEKAGKTLAEQLKYQGLEATFMASRELDLKKQGVKILTLKAAKGLEFPIVAIAGFLNTPFPTIPRGTPDEAKAEIYQRERRTLFVAMTRAMRALLLVVPAQNPGRLLQQFDPQLWNLGKTVK